MRLKTIAAMSAAMLVASGGAAQTVPAKTPVNTKPAADPDAKICHIEDLTGSIFTHKVCRTRREWTQVEAANSADTDRIFRMRRGINGKIMPGD